MDKDTNDDIIIINIKLIDINNIKCRKSKYHTTIICNNVTTKATTNLPSKARWIKLPWQKYEDKLVLES